MITLVQTINVRKNAALLSIFTKIQRAISRFIIGKRRRCVVLKSWNYIADVGGHVENTPRICTRFVACRWWNSTTEYFRLLLSNSALLTGYKLTCCWPAVEEIQVSCRMSNNDANTTSGTWARWEPEMASSLAWRARFLQTVNCLLCHHFHRLEWKYIG